MIKKTLFYFMTSLLMIGFLEGRGVCSKPLNDEDQLILVGIGAYRDGFYDTSEKQFSQFVRDYPNHAKVYDICYLLGKTLLNKGKLREAKNPLVKIITENKSFEYTDYTLFWLAEIEMGLGNRVEAYRLFSSIVKRFPKFEWIDYSFYMLGLLDYVSNKLVQAESSFKKVALLSKNNELVRSAWFWIGILYYRQENYEDSSATFRRIWDDPTFVSHTYLRYSLFWLGASQSKSGKWNDAKIHYRAFMDRFKDDPLVSEASWRLGFCEYRLGNIREAIEIFQSFKKQFKDPQLISYTQYLLGEIFLAQGDYSSSIKELNLLFNYPKENVWWGPSALILFWNYVHLGEIEEANRIFQRLQKGSPFEEEKAMIQWLNGEMAFSEGRILDSLPYYFNTLQTRYREKALYRIGKGYFFEAKFRDAITNLDIFLLEFPNSPYGEESLFLKGECLFRMGNIDEALETYEVISRKNGNSLWRLFSLTQLGRICSSSDQNDQAEAAFKRVILEFPDHPLFYHAALQLGNLYLKKKDTAQAISYYSIVLKGNLIELLGEASFGLGEVFYQQGKYDKAFTSFETAVRYLKENSLAFFLTQFEIGNIQKRWGKYEEAKKSYKIVLDHSKDEEMKQIARRLLDHMESP